MIKKRQHRLNDEIKASEVRVTDVGVMPFSEAIALATSKEMDLVLINDKTTPPICKIVNYDKFIYELGRKEREKPKALEMKEIQLGPNTSDNDLSYRIKHVTEFLQKGHKVKLSMRFKGREMTYVQNGEALMLKMLLAVQEFGVAESMPKLDGKNMFATIRPKTTK